MKTRADVTHDRSVGELVTSLTDDAKQLFRAELRLAKFQTSESVERAGRGSLWLAVAFGVLVVALVAFTLFLATLIGRLAGGHHWVGAILTGVLELVLGAWLVRRGLQELGRAPYALPETRAGLRGVWKLDRTPEAQNPARMAKPDDQGRSLLGYMSVRFMPIHSQWAYATNPGEKDKVTRTEARLTETSLVSMPAYQGAHVEWVRSMDPALRSEARGHKLAGWEEYLAKVKQGPLP